MVVLWRMSCTRPIAARLCATRAHVRLVHSTPVVLKKKHSKNSPVPPSFFEDEGNEDLAQDPSENDLFASPMSSENPKTTPDARPDRAEMFDSLLASTLQYFAKPGKKGNPPRHSVIPRLSVAADSKEHLEKVLELVATFRNAGMPIFSEAFFGRCIHLDCPDLILRVLQNRPKYGMDIPSLTAARSILNKLARQRKDDIDAVVTDCLQFAELYPLYGFPPASSDLVSSVILAGVIARRTAKSKGAAVSEKVDNVVEDEPFLEILKEVKAATASWDPTAVAGMEGRWVRRSMNFVMSAARQARGVEPWLLDFKKQLEYA